MWKVLPWGGFSATGCLAVALDSMLFSRPEANGEKAESDGGLPSAPRSLNSDISYFGVGGKQAIFFIGTSTRVRMEHLSPFIWNFWRTGRFC